MIGHIIYTIFVLTCFGLCFILRPSSLPTDTTVGTITGLVQEHGQTYYHISFTYQGNVRKADTIHYENTNKKYQEGDSVKILFDGQKSKINIVYIDDPELKSFDNTLSKAWLIPLFLGIIILLFPILKFLIK